MIDDLLRLERSTQRQLLKLERKRYEELRKIRFRKRVKHYMSKGETEIQANFSALYCDFIGDILTQENPLLKRIHESHTWSTELMPVPTFKDEE